MENEYRNILSAEETFAREVALGVHVAGPLTVWHYLIPGMFILDFLRRGSAIRRYSGHFLFPRKLALDAARDIALGEEKETRLRLTAEEIRSWLTSLNLYSGELLGRQGIMIDLLVDHYLLLFRTKTDSYYSMIERAYGTQEKYEAFLARLAAAEDEVDRQLLAAQAGNERLPARLEAEKMQVEKQRKKHTEKIFAWIG